MPWRDDHIVRNRVRVIRLGCQWRDKRKRAFIFILCVQAIRRRVSFFQFNILRRIFLFSCVHAWCQLTHVRLSDISYLILFQERHRRSVLAASDCALTELVTKFIKTSSRIHCKISLKFLSDFGRFIATPNNQFNLRSVDVTLRHYWLDCHEAI